MIARFIWYVDMLMLMRKRDLSAVGDRHDAAETGSQGSQWMGIASETA